MDYQQVFLLKEIVKEKTVMKIHQHMIRYTKLITFVCYSICIFSSYNCWTQNWRNSNPIQVSISDKNTPYGETYIAVNPNNSSEMIITAMYTSEVSILNHFNYNIALFKTSNNAKSWEKIKMPVVKNILGSGDPWIVWGNNGVIYFSYIAFIKIPKEKTELKVFIVMSKNKGKTWSSPTEVFKGTKSHDHPMLTYNSLNNNPLTVFTTGGKGLSSTQIAAFNEDLTNGDIFIHGQGSESNNNLGAGVSLDNGVYIFIQTKNIHELRSISTSDFGRNFIETSITKRCVPYGFPMLTFDNSNKTHHNRLYAVWSEKGDIGTQIFMSFSDNFGKNWTVKKQISLSQERINLMPQVEVNLNGDVLVAWASPESDARLDCYNLNYAISKKGGEIFSQKSLTIKKICSRTKKNGSVSQKWKLGGDYFGIDSDASGNFHISWADSRTGIYQIWYSTIFEYNKQ